jgi:peptide subunit release factor RF-3
MDPKHHDRLAFMRLVSGQYNKGMKILQVSTGKQIKIANAVTFMSRERSSAACYPACCGNVNGFKLTINPVFVFQTVGNHIKLQNTHGTENLRMIDYWAKYLSCPFF